uniref:Putative RNA-directed DNA polymerase from transposon BS n=1 Tax=Anoplophora glabripennis TaxID=217634 RepID=V5GI42_ANOGL
MSKAFDSIDFSCLLAKLFFYGIHNKCHDWFDSYIKDRMQLIRIKTENGSLFSEPRIIKSGVPQGSVLGPLLFSICTADFVSSVVHTTLHMYADDLQILYSFEIDNKQTAVDLINSDLHRIKELCDKNALMLNPNKCKNLVIGTYQKTRQLGDFAVYIDNCPLENCSSVKNLGLVFDNDLKFSQHVSELCKKAFISFKQIAPLKRYLSSDIKLVLVESLVLSHLNYCDYVYGPLLANADKFKLQKIQNWCMRFVTYIPFLHHVTPFIRQFGKLRLSERRYVHFCVFVNKILCNTTPDYLYEKLVWRHDVHDRQLRNLHDLQIMRHRTEYFRCSFTYLAGMILNNVLVPQDLTLRNAALIKKRIRELVMENDNSTNAAVF